MGSSTPRQYGMVPRATVRDNGFYQKPLSKDPDHEEHIQEVSVHSIRSSHGGVQLSRTSRRRRCCTPCSGHHELHRRPLDPDELLLELNHRPDRMPESDAHAQQQWADRRQPGDAWVELDRNTDNAHHRLHQSEFTDLPRRLCGNPHVVDKPDLLHGNDDLDPKSPAKHHDGRMGRLHRIVIIGSQTVVGSRSTRASANNGEANEGIRVTSRMPTSRGVRPSQILRVHTITGWSAASDSRTGCQRSTFANAGFPRVHWAVDSDLPAS